VTIHDADRPATVTSGHLALTTEHRDRIREELLGALDGATRRLVVASEEQDQAAQEVHSEAVEAIRSALVKLTAGYYGVCERCEGPIPFERLEALPAVRYCVACQIAPHRLLGPAVR
jgi:RNA polymerase-binding transcription factor DksA